MGDNNNVLSESISHYEEEEGQGNKSKMPENERSDGCRKRKYESKLYFSSSTPSETAKIMRG